MKFTITRILLYLCFVTAIYSCTHEKDFVENNNRDFKISKKQFKDLLLLESFNTALKKVNIEKQRNKSLRTAMEDEFNFTIVEGKDVNIVEKENYTYYNILIERTVKDSLYFENLVLKITANEDMDAFIAKYNKNNLNATIHEEGDFELTTIIQRISGICFNVCTIKCYDLGSGEYSSPHALTSDCTGNNVGLDCFPVCIPSNPTGGYTTPSWNNGDPGSGGGGESGATTMPEEPNNDHGGGSSETELVVLPVLELEDEEETVVPDPCNELSELLKPNDTIITDEFQLQDTIKRPKLKQTLINVRPYVDYNQECGYELSYEKAGKKYTKDFADGKEGDYSISFNIDNFIYGSIHTHPLLGVKIPSFGDLVLLRNTYNGILPYNRDKLTVIVVVKNPNGAIPATLTYALKIENFAVFSAKIDAVLNSYGSIPYNKKMETILYDEGKYYSSPNANLEKLFFDKFSTFGVGLYKADDNLTTWDKLSSNGTVVTNTPCN